MKDKKVLKDRNSVSMLIYTSDTRHTFRVPWTARRSNQSVHPKGDQPWVFFGRTDVETETPILWLPDVKN